MFSSTILYQGLVKAVLDKQGCVFWGYYLWTGLVQFSFNFFFFFFIYNTITPIVPQTYSVLTVYNNHTYFMITPTGFEFEPPLTSDQYYYRTPQPTKPPRLDSQYLIIHEENVLIFAHKTTLREVYLRCLIPTLVAFMCNDYQ